MARIEAVSIKNFRSIKDFYYRFRGSKFSCIIGRGNSGKSTILEAISRVLSPAWSLHFDDTDFYNCDIANQIEITVFLVDLPENLIREDKYGLFLQFYDCETGKISQQPQEKKEVILELKLVVDQNLEPIWSVVKEDKSVLIRSGDRSKVGAYLIADNLETHFSWKKTSPLKAILKSNGIDTIHNEEVNPFLTVARKAKSEIDILKFPLLEEISSSVSSTATEFGGNTMSLDTTIDIKNILLNESTTALHESNIPVRLLGKGAQRILSIAIQIQLFKEKGLLLIDEIEQGLEPDRVQHLVSTLKCSASGHTFMTTHSRDVLVELSSSNVLLMKEGASTLISFDDSFTGTIRKNPEAFFAKSIIICEGATEIGFCRYLNKYRMDSGKGNISTKGIRLVDGAGSEMDTYVQKFAETHGNVCLFCDSDDSSFNSKKSTLNEAGVEIVDCDEGKNLEEQIFSDLPWDGIKELIAYRILHTSRDQIEASIASKYEKELPEDWIEKDDGSIRNILGALANKKSWFKRIDHGEYLCEICTKHLAAMSGTAIHKEIQRLEDWIDNA